MFIPTTSEEVKKLNWQKLDIILISGDTYFDTPYNGASIIGHYLIEHGYKVGIIAQPTIKSGIDITRLDEPKLFWGITSGSVDSMVSNYTASKKRRKNDDLTPGGINDRRPDRALIAYTNLIRQNYKNTVPIVLGGIEASLRRIAHYDHWSNNVRRSILFDAKADILIYGMGEKPVLELANAISQNIKSTDIKGICYISNEKKGGHIELDPYEKVSKDKKAFLSMFDTFYKNIDPKNAVGLIQKHGERFLIHNPPSDILTTTKLDRIYGLPYERKVHPYYQKMGRVKAMETIQFSITTHRGCFGECNFCAIQAHQGKNIISRSESSIINEAKAFTKHPDFKGIIHDVGGPTANMYGFECSIMQNNGACKTKKCISSNVCDNLISGHKKQINLLKKFRNINGLKRIFIGSGIRHDLVLNDTEYGDQYLNEILKNHISGQMKLAPEHSQKKVLRLMGKPNFSELLKFKKLFDKINKQLNKKQFLTYYFIAAHPGCTDNDMTELKKLIKKELKLNPEQIQIFTPTPSTYSTLMYYTGIDPVSNEDIFVEREMSRMEKQKRIITNGK